MPWNDWLDPFLNNQHFYTNADTYSARVNNGKMSYRNNNLFNQGFNLLFDPTSYQTDVLGGLLSGKTSKDYLIDDLDRYLVNELGSRYSNIDEALRRRILSDSGDNTSDMFGTKYTYDLEKLKDEFNAIYDAYNDVGDTPLREDYLADARAQIEAEDAENIRLLDELMNEQVADYNTQLGNLEASYNRNRQDILSRQNMQNAQLMDTVQSEMSRSRQSALEAGASAGIRIANNINTLLSTQNQQTNASMETANQLSQMMVSQRNAEAGIRSDYAALRRDNTNQRINLNNTRNQRASTLAGDNYNAASGDYDTNVKNYNRQFTDNSFYDAFKR